MPINQKPKPKKSPLDKYLFDDCPICQAMKRADDHGRSLTLPELKRAFKKANRRSVASGKD